MIMMWLTGMFANYKLLLEFPGEFQSTDSCAKGTKTVAVGTIDFILCEPVLV